MHPKYPGRRRRDRKIVTKVCNVPESHFYPAHELARLHLDPVIILPTRRSKRKVGRPFKGDVEEFTKEPHVPERRSILRGFKKFYAKKEFDDILGIRGKKSIISLLTGEIVVEKKSTYMQSIYEGLGRNDLQNV